MIWIFISHIYSSCGLLKVQAVPDHWNNFKPNKQFVHHLQSMGRIPCPATSGALGNFNHMLTCNFSQYVKILWGSLTKIIWKIRVNVYICISIARTGDFITTPHV